MTAPIQSKNTPQYIQDDSSEQMHGCLCIYWKKRVKKLPEQHLGATEAFRREFQPRQKDGLVASPPIRANPSTGLMEVAYNSGRGIEWRPIDKEVIKEVGKK